MEGRQECTAGEACDWCRGYQEQVEWLRGKTSAEAQQALDSRLATLNDSNYNRGGNAATRDYISWPAETVSAACSNSGGSE